MSGHVLFLTVVPLARDPRARRAAAAAEVAGVAVRAASIGAPESRRGSGLRRLGRRAGTRELRGLFRLARLLLLTVRLVLSARDSTADIVHAHDLDTLPAGWLLARRRGARLVYDAHELYSGFENDPPRLWARVTRALEGALARRADAVVTVNDAIAGELERRFQLPRPPLVVLNCPPVEEVAVEPRDGRPVRAIYQAAVGPGRHVEDVAAAANVTDVEITVRLLGGEGLSLPGVLVEPPVKPRELVTALTPYDVGLVIDRPETENARLALPNKLFEYLMAGLAVAVPRAPAMAELVETHGVGVVYDAGGLGTALDRLAADRSAVDAMRKRARALALERFNAEAQRPALLAAWGL